MNVKRMTPTRKLIVQVLEESPNPMTKSEIAEYIGVSYQTVNVHLTELIRDATVELAYRAGNTSAYKISNEQSRLLKIVINDKSVAVKDYLRSFSTQSLPNNPYMRIIIRILAQFYKLSAAALDDDSPVALSQAQLKSMQAELNNAQETIKKINVILNSLINNVDLWNPAKLPAVMILRDPEMTNELANDIAGLISELMSS